MRVSIALALFAAIIGVSKDPLSARTRALAPTAAPAIAHPIERSPPPVQLKTQAVKAESREPLVVLTPSSKWFAYPRGCSEVTDEIDLLLHFHGAHTTVIPQFVASGLDAILVIINKGIGSGPYSRSYALKSQIDDLLAYVRSAVAGKCARAEPRIRRLALSSWSAGYGAVEQFLRLRPERVDAVLLSDGLHVGFTDPRRRIVDGNRLTDFASFAARASRGEKLMAITHSAIEPQEYAASGETALFLSNAIGAPTFARQSDLGDMQQLTAARRGEFYVQGFAGADKDAHSQHLYNIGKTAFSHLKAYWNRER